MFDKGEAGNLTPRVSGIELKCSAILFDELLWVNIDF